MLTPEEVRDLSRPSAAASLAAIAFDWACIFILFWLNVKYPSPWLLFVSIILMARFQYALFILKHDAAHSLLFRSRRQNDIIGQLAVAPLFLSMLAYRKHHLIHHRDPLAPTDPDLSLTGGYPITKASFRRKLTRDLLGISYVKLMPYYFGTLATTRIRKNSGEAPHARGTSLMILLALIFHIALCVWLYRHDSIALYPLLWWVPLISPLQLMLRIRGITEHAGYQPNKNQALNTRTVINPLQTFFLAPHQVHYHIEHHLYPSIPWFRLPRAHKLLKERGALPAPNVYSSYVGVMRDLIK